MTKPIKDKFAIAAALQEIGTLLELKGGEYFKARAYKSGARSVSELTEDLGKLIKENRLTYVKGIGHGLATQIAELYTTGQSPLLNQLRTEMPAGIVELTAVRGLTVKKVQLLQSALGITTVAELKVAAEAGKLRDVKGFGAKTESAILEAIAGSQNREQRIHIHQALRAGESIVEYLKESRDFGRAEFGGGLRRWKETVSQIVIIASTERPQALIRHFLSYPTIVRTEEQSKDRAVVVLSEGFKTTLIAVPPKKFAVALFNATGSEAHLQKLNQFAAVGRLAKRYARLRRDSSKAVEVKDEAQIYRSLGMQFVPPEMREDQGEIEAALTGKIPEDLVTADHIRGMVHCHTTYSDGKHSVEQMVAAAEALGMKYITITDHSPTAFYAGGVKIDRLQRQWEEIDEVQQKTKVKILKGTESDIVADGALDYPDWILEQFDVIVASIHSRYKMDEDKMTRRIVTAMRQPVFKIWGHALGRKIQARPPFDCRVEEILDAIAESRAAVEINGDPYRLDMEPRWLREARKRKIKFVVSVDAHSVGALNNLKFGVGIARRAGIRKGEVLNTLGAKAFQKAVRPV